jgi:nucleoside-diphosphate-sugar epimerase
MPVKGDITRPGPWQNEARSADVVVHGAAMVSDWGPRKEFFRVNVGGTRNILDAVKTWDGHFIHLSSIAVHGFRTGTFVESSPVTPNKHPYCASKAAAEQLVDTAVKTGLKASLARIAGVYGPGDPHFIVRFLDQARSGRVFIIGRGNQPSNLVYIDDVIEGLIRIMRRECEPGERFVLSDPAAPDVLTMVRIAKKILDLHVQVRRVPEWSAHALAALHQVRARLTRSYPRLTRYAVRAMGHSCVFSPEATAYKLGWSPRMSVQEGVERTISWYRENRPSSGPSIPFSSVRSPNS